MTKRITRRKGFSLVEMLVVVSVMAIIFSGATVLISKKVDRDLTFNKELNETALRISSSIYREIYNREPESIHDLVQKGLLLSVD